MSVSDDDRDIVQRQQIALLRAHCDHRRVAVFDRGRSIPETGKLMEYRTCGRCHAWLPLGPSNDSDPRVQLEVRAAELAALARDGKQIPHDGRRGRGPYIGCAACGWNAGERSIGFLDGKPSTLAGYLARCIATHDEELP